MSFTYFSKEIRANPINLISCVLASTLNAGTSREVSILNRSSTTMSKPTPKKINIFLSLDKDIFKGYFNAQDPAPLYKRQLSYDFEQYIMTSIRSAKRESVFNYRITYSSEEDRQYAEPLMYAIRRQFAESRAATVASFQKFKERTYKLLFLSLAFVMISQCLAPLILNEENRLHTGLHNSMDVLCWVILWKPIDRLIFYWNPFLKDISIFERLEKAEVTITEIESELPVQTAIKQRA